MSEKLVHMPGINSIGGFGAKDSALIHLTSDCKYLAFNVFKIKGNEDKFLEYHKNTGKIRKKS